MTTEIHTLSYRRDPDANPEHCSGFSVVIDGIKERFIFVVYALEMSSKADGIYPILNCSCGEWGCGGAHVKVSNQEDTVTWESTHVVDFETDQSALSLKGKVVFDRKNYEEIIADLLREQDKYKWEKNVYEMDKQEYEKTGELKSYSY